MRGATAREAHVMDEPVEQIMQFFTYEHLKPELQVISKPFAELAAHVVQQAPRSAERTVALRKLLESKDAAVRALLVQPVPYRDRHSGPVTGP